MTVTAVVKDAESLTMTVSAEFDAPVARVWEVWSDPRQLERWWGPPTYPATVVEHSLEPGGGVVYFMTGPEGDVHYGWWSIVAAEPPHRLEFEDGFGDETGARDPSMPTVNVVVELHATADGGTLMTTRTVFPSTGAMEQMVAMGMEEGMRAAAGQIDALLA
jgi:uncharacterized protein YndB with AHSA1/START domain